MQAYIFESVLKDEFNAFFCLRRSQGIKDQNRFIWEYLDRYLVNSHTTEKAMTPEKVEDWISSSCTGLKDKSVDGLHHTMHSQNTCFLLVSQHISTLTHYP